jgi:DNA (cytosine-5)-methyltransferase 1
MAREINAISLFSGAGGDTLGMKNAGINVIGYVELDPDSIKTHNYNFSECKHIGSDITKITDTEFQKYNVDIIFGGFPCQSFSHGGKKDCKDKRGFLYQEFVRTAKIIKPKCIIGENVQGLLSRKMEDGVLFIDKIMGDFTDIGYNMKFHIFNMKDFGVAQSRKRIIIYGIRKDLNITCNLNLVEKSKEFFFNKNIVNFSLENALKIDDIKIINEIKKGNVIENLSNNDSESGKPPTNLIKCYTKKEISFGTRASPTHSCIVDLNDVSRTILCSYGRMPRLFVSMRNSNGYYLRPYTISELQLIQGFPETFIFCGSYIQKIKQIGNAISPIFVTYITKYIKDLLLGDSFETFQNTKSHK